MAKVGKPRREDMELPPKVRQAILLRSQGLSWIQCAENVGVTPNNLRAWRKHPDFEAFLSEAIKENLAEAHTLFSDAAPKLAARLIQLGLDPKVKPYAQIQAISESFRILQQGVIERENREQLKKIRTALEALEGGATHEVIDV